MLSRLRSVAPHLSSALSYQTNRVFKSTPKETTYYCFLSANAFSSKVATASADSSPSTTQISDKPEVKVNLNAMFWSKPCSLSLAKDSPLRIEEPDFSGIKQFMLKLLLFYSKQSKSIRGANVVYKRIISQVDKPPIYDVFNLEKTFKTTFSLLVLHMWLVLRRLKEEGKEGTEFGQYLYEIYNHDVEVRVAKAGVNLLLTKWMKDLEKIFYGNIVAYDAALTQEAKHEDLANVLWRNIFSEDGSDSMRDAASTSVQAMARYTRRELTCLSLTEKEAIYSGNFLFTPLTSPTRHTGKKSKRKQERESMLMLKRVLHPNVVDAIGKMFL